MYTFLLCISAIGNAKRFIQNCNLARSVPFPTTLTITPRTPYLSYFSTPSARTGYDTRSIFKRCLTGFNSEFSFSETSYLTKAEEPSLPNYLPIAGGRIIGFIPFPRVLVLCEMQSVSSRIWTRVAVSISYDDNYYTTGTLFMNAPLLSLSLSPSLSLSLSLSHSYIHIYIYIYIYIMNRTTLLIVEYTDCISAEG